MEEFEAQKKIANDFLDALDGMTIPELKLECRRLFVIVYSCKRDLKELMEEKENEQS